MTELINYIFQTRYHVIAAEVLNSSTISSLWSSGFTLCGLGHIYTHLSDGLAASIFRVEIIFGTENGNISFRLMSCAHHQGDMLSQPKVPHLNTPCHENLELVLNTGGRHVYYRIQPDLLKRNLGITETCI